MFIRDLLADVLSDLEPTSIWANRSASKQTLPTSISLANDKISLLARRASETALVLRLFLKIPAESSWYGYILAIVSITTVIDVCFSQSLDLALKFP